MQEQKLFFSFRFPQVQQEENKNDKARIKINIHVANIVNFDQNINGQNGKKCQSGNAFLCRFFAVNNRNCFVIIGQIAFYVF